MGERRVDPVMHAEAMHRLGLDKPLPAQYFDYVSSLAQGNFGESLVTRESVWKEFVTLFPATVELSAAAMLFAIVLGLLAGAVLTETIFSWPGIGKWLIDAIGRRDYPVVQNGILIVATLVIIVNFTVDILYGVANPRIRHQK